ncbi:MAG: methyltransferase domain-containing protein [Motiliproteus sp.]
MNTLEKAHNRCVFQRRVKVLSQWLISLLPMNARVLDVGCGDGLISSLIKQKRPDLTINGIDVLIRNKTHVPVSIFDGHCIPYESGSFDAVILVDVLHHTVEPNELLQEAKRVSSNSVLIKDHCQDALLAKQTLLFMDWVGNSHQGVALPYNYWSERQWREAFGNLDLSVHSWNTRLGLYPWPANLFFERSLHFVAELTCGTHE